MNRTVEIDCPDAQRHWLARAIHEFAELAFPPGGSECAQVSREALQATAAGLGRPPPGQRPGYNRRQRVLVCQAVDHACELAVEAGVLSPPRAELHRRAIRGEPVSEVEWMASGG